MRKVLFILCVCFLSTVVNAHAQAPAFRNYGLKEGLPSSETYCIMQDSRGYIFIGTDKGLVRFDGTNFETYTTGDGLVDNTVFFLSEYRGKLWYSTFSGNIGYICRDSLFPFSLANRLSFPANTTTTSMVIGDTGLLLVNRISEMGYSVNGIDQQGKVSAPFPTPADTNWRNDYLTRTGRCIKTGTLYAENIRVFTQNNKLLGTFHNPNRAILHDFSYLRGDKTWLSIKEKVYVSDGNTFKKVLDLESELPHLENEILYVFVDKQQNIWAGYQHKGLVLYRQSEEYKKPVRLLPFHSISGILQDNEGGMWFTTLENGVYYLPPDFLFSIAEKTNGLAGKTIKILKQNDRPIFFQSGNTLLALNKADSCEPVFMGRRIFSASPSTNGKIYFTGEVESVTPQNANSFIPVEYGRILHVGKRVLSTANCRLLWSDLDGRKYRDESFPRIGRFTCAEEIGDDTYLFGTLRGLFIYNNGRLVQYAPNVTELTCRISDIKNLNDHQVAVATHGNGILLLDKDKLTITGHITKADGLRGTVVNTLYRESDSVLWVGTNNGLGRIGDPGAGEKMTLSWVDVNDGILSNEINDICQIGSHLWLATAKGVTLFPLDKKSGNDGPIPVLLSSITVNGKAWRNPQSELKYNQNNISIKFIGINYHFGKDLKYAYRLKGSGDTTWNYTSTPTVNYNSLGPGHYIFEYSALAPGKKNVSHYNSFSFTITSPFWLTWWFMLFIVLIVSASLYIVIQRRFRIVKKRMQLVSDLNMYRDRALRNQMSPHFIYNSLNLLGNFVMKMDEKTAMAVLTKFSMLMRLTFKNTGEKLVTIESDLEALRLYTEMESLRFPGKFDIEIPASLPDDLNRCLVPPLLIQPFVENAILHGLLPKKDGGKLFISVTRENDAIRILIEDNGVGRAAAREIRKRKEVHLTAVQNQRGEDSGITVTTARIKQVWHKYPEKSRFKIVDLHNSDGVPTGTLVEFYLPPNDNDKSYNN